MTNGKHSSERACIVCRQVRPRPQMLGLSQAGGVVCLGRPSSGKKGRGAWVCIAPECLEGARPQHLSRAFRTQVTIPDVLGGPSRLALGPECARLGRKRLLEILGLARRQGVLVLGVDEIFAGDEVPGGVVLCATDLSERTLRLVRGRLAGSRTEEHGAWFIGDAEALGSAIGVPRAGVVQVLEGRLAEQARYWLSVIRASGGEAPTEDLQVCFNDREVGKQITRFDEIEHERTVC